MGWDREGRSNLQLLQGHALVQQLALQPVGQGGGGPGQHREQLHEHACVEIIAAGWHAQKIQQLEMKREELKRGLEEGGSEGWKRERENVGMTCKHKQKYWEYHI